MSSDRFSFARTIDSPTREKCNLFKHVNVGGIELRHRIVMAPMTRNRADNDYTPNDPMLEYYSERGKGLKGGLMISEATLIAKKAGLYPNMPGIWNEKQISAWKKITDQVHESGSIFFMQLSALGRTASRTLNAEEGVIGVSPSGIDLDEPNTITHEIIPTLELEKKDIRNYIKLYARAARNAINAGADGVEIYAANGCLINQFLDAHANQRTDDYGGSIANRARFLLEIVDAVVNAIGHHRVSIRLSPWLNNFLAAYEISPIPQFSYVITELEKRVYSGKRLAYIHIIEPGVMGDVSLNEYEGNNNWIRSIWTGIIVRAGGFGRETAIQTSNADNKTLIAFGRYFTSNPDFSQLLYKNVPVNKYDRSTFYSGGRDGYTKINENLGKINV